MKNSIPVNEANKILQTFNINYFTFSSVIAAKLNIEVIEIDPKDLNYEKFLAAIIKEADSFVIYVNKFKVLKTINFAIAMLIGSAVLNKQNFLISDYDVFEKIDSDLFLFANSLLMPRSWINDVLEEVSTDSYFLSDIFNVPKYLIDLRRTYLTQN